MKTKSLSESPFFNVLLFSVFWALQIFIAKLGFLHGAKAVTMVFQSAFVALSALSIYVLPKHYGKLKVLPKNILIGLLVANAIHFGLGGFFSNSGIALTSAVNAGFLVKFALVTTTVLAWIFLKEKMTWVKFIAVMVLLFFILLTPLYPSSIQRMFTVNLFDTTYFVYALGSGLFTALLWIYLNRTLKVASASYMTMMSMMTSIFVAVLALVFLKETMTLSQTVGAVLTIGAGVVTHYSGVAKG